MIALQEEPEDDGHQVEVAAGGHGAIFPKLGAGNVGRLVADWAMHGVSPK